MNLTALLILADSRLPAGTHAHSGGLEAAVAAERVNDAHELYEFLLGRLTTTGLVVAAFSAAALDAVDLAQLTELDAEYDARTPSPAQRRVSRSLGRQLLRAASAGWSGPTLSAAATVHPAGPHQPIAFGAAASAAGLSPSDVATASALGSVTGPASSATRLTGIDPDSVTAVLAALEPHVQATADAATKAALGPYSELPSFSAPRLDISAEHHSTWEVRLFAS